ncbi:hypothetical protein FACS1894187_21640 [Synergistales bacterium]|nr:hypothetical protein FACS1894187_21640 [Synergistales bacterium]
MKRSSSSSFSKNTVICALLFVAFLLLSVTGSWANPVPPEDAARMVKGWLNEDKTPLGEILGSVERVEMYGESSIVYSQNDALYYAVFLSPKGIVFVPADDLVEPVVAFQPQANDYDLDENSPFNALVITDLKARVKAARSGAITSTLSTSSPDTPQNKWNRLKSGTTTASLATSPKGIPSVSDLRVAPLLKTEWNQESTPPSYNYYTPNNYPSGCVATAVGQILRYFEWPKNAIGAKTFNIQVDGEVKSGTTRGGDGLGGAYLWSGMPNKVDDATTETQRKNIGALLSDIGISVRAIYWPSSTSAFSPLVFQRLLDTFQYSNVIYAENEGLVPISNSDLTLMINPNLDAKLPVFLGINSGPGYGHAVVVDGYGYSASALYHHVNLGWGGNDNVWYALPSIDTVYNFSIIESCTYNIYTSGTGEIVSGRVVDTAGSPVSGVTVSLSGSTISPATTNEKGIFFFKNVPSNTSYTVEATKGDLVFDSKTINTTQSISPEIGEYGHTIASGSHECGNVWDVKITGDFTQDFTVTFDSQSGSVVAPITGIVSGATITAPTSPTRSGYIFDGWYKEASCTNIWDFSADTVTANITLYAKWTQGSASTFTVTFDSRGGSSVSSATGIASGAIITAPTSPTRSGYTFDGWYKEASYLTKWNFLTDTVTANITLYAKWTSIGGGDGGGEGGGGGGCNTLGIGFGLLAFSAALAFRKPKE